MTKGNKKATHEEFTEKLNIKFKGKIIALEIYKDSKTPITFMHNSSKCNYHKWKTKPNTILSNKGCPKCNGTHRRTNEEFVEEIKKTTNGEYIPLTRFVKVTSKLKMKHLNENCNNHEWSITPNDFISGGKRCPVCGLKSRIKKTTKTKAEFEMEIFILTQGEYVMVGEYNGNSNKTIIKHNSPKCGFTIYETTPQNFLSNRRCPECSRSKTSKGEQEVKRILREKCLNFKHQYRFKNCKNILPLPFDFVLLAKNSDVECVIEYDGEQHFKGWQGNKESLKQIQHNDQIKNQYCKDNNIPLIRIPYWDFDNIETILEKELITLGIIREESAVVDIRNIARVAINKI